MSNLLIITGAGASFDVAAGRKDINVNAYYRPPLTNKLFVSGEAQLIECVKECLEKNPIAAQVGADLKHHESLEKYLRELKDSGKIELRRRYWSIPIYLHDLFEQIGFKYIKSAIQGVPSNYNSLLTSIIKSKYKQIIWLNLNYDMLADYAIRCVVKKMPETLGEYMNLEMHDGQNIKYTKPHGSIGWYRMNELKTGWANIRINGRVPSDFEQRLSKKIYLKNQVTQLGTIESIAYPAISAPLGKYDYVCQEHIENICPDLEKTSSILCIGFSALDEDILDLILKYVKDIKKLKIVNGDAARSADAYSKIAQYFENKGRHLSFRRETAIFNEGFSGFITGGHIDSWLSE